MERPWIKQLMKSHDHAGVTNADGKDFFNMIVFTNYPTDHPEDDFKYPSQSYIVSQFRVPKYPLANPIHLMQIASTVEQNGKIPSWFEE